MQVRERRTHEERPPRRRVPPDELDQFEAFLADLGYRYWEETENPAYRLFLGGT